jgi:hypothetical protein
MKRIVIDMYDETDGHLNEMIVINSEELCLNYSDIINLHGLQSMYDGNDERHIKQMDICHKITKLVKELSDIS